MNVLTEPAGVVAARAGVAEQGGVRHVRGQVPRLERVPNHLPVPREQGLRVSVCHELPLF